MWNCSMPKPCLEDTVNTIMPDAFTDAELKQLAAR